MTIDLRCVWVNDVSRLADVAVSHGGRRYLMGPAGLLKSAIRTVAIPRVSTTEPRRWRKAVGHAGRIGSGGKEWDNASRIWSGKPPRREEPLLRKASVVGSEVCEDSRRKRNAGRLAGANSCCEALHSGSSFGHRVPGGAWEELSACTCAKMRHGRLVPCAGHWGNPGSLDERVKDDAFSCVVH